MKGRFLHLITGTVLTISVWAGSSVLYCLQAQLAKPTGLSAAYYHPEGDGFVKVNGTKRFNRALYGTNTAFRVEAGDLPEFAMYLPGMGGNIKLGLQGKGGSKWLTQAQQIKATYKPGTMVYEIGDAMLGSGRLYITVLPMAMEEGMLIKVSGSGMAVANLCFAYGGVTGKKFSRDGDIGADPESSFYMKPEYCRNNVITLKERNSFSLGYAPGKTVEGVLPANATIQLADASYGQTPEMLLQSKPGEAPVITCQLPLKNGQVYYFLLGRPATTTAGWRNPEQSFKAAEQARLLLANRINVQTPDPWINNLGGALSVAADGIWEDPTYLHGAVAWRMRLPAWRGPYVADPLGWHNRARTHYSSYALSQVTSPATGPVVSDTALHLARQQEKMGNSMFSSGYICRNPNGDIRPHHYDMNLVYIDGLLRHFKWTGDTAYIRKMWPVLQRHLAWEKRNFDTNDDGLYDAYCCIWASDGLQYSGGAVTHSSAYNYYANKTVAQLAKLIGEDPVPFIKEADKIKSAMHASLWMADRGWYAEYRDTLGAKLLHPAAGLWTIYHALDSELPDEFQAYQSLKYIDNHIPHIPVGTDLPGDSGAYLLSTTNWQPYTWSLNNVALAENLHTALAYWQGKRPEEAFALWRSALVESMYKSSCPGGFEQLSVYDAIRGELYRDFADPIGMAARSLVEGLFGIQPDALRDTLYIRPGFPAFWKHAAITTPDLKISYKYNNNTDTYIITPSLPSKMPLLLTLNARAADVQSVTVNDKPVKWNHIVQLGIPAIAVKVSAGNDYVIKVAWKNSRLNFLTSNHKPALRSEMEWFTIASEIIDIYDPQQVLSSTDIQRHRLRGTVNKAGNHSFFTRLKQGKMEWWQPIQVNVEELEPGYANSTPLAALPAGTVIEPVSMTAYFNDKVTNIFRQQYMQPRLPIPTLQLPTQGIGNWCYPLTQADIDDSGLRKAAMNNLFITPQGVHFETPADSNKNNILFTSRWDNYPQQQTVPLSGKAKHIYLMLAGSTNAMQSQVVNGIVTVNYKDGSREVIELINPHNWCPVEQDYLEQGPAFHLPQKRPLRIYLKTGKVATELSEYQTIKGYSTRAIDGGAGVILDQMLDRNKELLSLTLETVANDVVIGLMAASLVR